MTVLILDGHLKSALSAVRSLGEKGIDVSVGSSRKFGMALHSRYAKSNFIYPDPKNNQTGFVDTIVSEARRIQEVTGERLLLYCFSDATHTSVVENYELLKEFLIFPIVSEESFSTAFDKQKTYQLGRSLRIPTISEIKEPSEFPVVLKPRHSVSWRSGKGFSGTASMAFSKSDFENLRNNLKEQTGEDPVIQKFITGHEYGVEVMCKEGAILQSFAHKRIRSLSPRGGAAMVKETAEGSKEVALMRQYTEKLMTELNWTGPAMVEFKVDDSNGQVKLMEINGRFWGSLPLPTAAGVDFAYGYWCLFNDKPIPSGVVKSVRTRHFLGDLKWLLNVLINRDQLRNRLYPSRLSAMVMFLSESFKSSDDVWRWSDPLPGLLEYIDVVWR